MNVSVIIPAFNAAETIAETLEALLAQSDPSWEAIVIDDGSRDATSEIVEGYIRRDARIRLVRQSNGGEGSARNAGLTLASHDWLLFLDADDWVAPSYIERMTQELATDPELDAVHCGSARVAPDGTLVVEQYLPPAGDMFDTWARRSAFPIHACIVRKSLVDAVGRFDTSLKPSADWDLWQRIARMGARFGAVREVLAYYRMRPSSSSLDARLLLKDGLRVLRQGHALDPRVPNPHPEHINGSPPEGVQTQEFYLLSWCAGLMLGSGRDARPLLEMLKDEHFSELHPDAVAQCIFDSAPLPTCGPPGVWEQLWPRIQPQVDDFLIALETQSFAPELARRARAALAKMVLKYSPAWQSIIEEREKSLLDREGAIPEVKKGMEALEQELGQFQRLGDERASIITQQSARIEELEKREASFQRERTDWQRLGEERSRAIAAQQNRITERDQVITAQQIRIAERDQTIAAQHDRIMDSEEVNAALRVELGDWRRWTHERETVQEQLLASRWVRAGFGLGLLKRPRETDSRNYDPDGARAKRWHLHVGGGSIASLVFPPHDTEMVRIAIASAPTKTRWDVQLNQPGLKVTSQGQYAVHLRARADEPRSIMVGLAQAHNPWNNLGLYQMIALTPQWQSFEQAFVASADEDNARIHFDLGGSSIPVELTAISLRGPSEAEAAGPGESPPVSSEQPQEAHAAGRGESAQTIMSVGEQND